METVQTHNVILELRSDALKKIARQLGAAKNLTRVGDIAAALEKVIENDLPAILNHCTDAQKNLLAEAAYNGGKINKRSFAGKYGYACPNRSYSWHAKEASPFDILVFTDKYDKDNVCVLPNIISILKELLREPEKLKIKTVDTIEAVFKYKDIERPVQVFEGEYTVFAELRQILTLAQAGKIKITPQNRRPTDAAVRDISASLLLPDFALEVPQKLARQWDDPAGPVRAHAWAVLLQQCGWCKATGTKLELSRVGKTLLSEISPEAMKTGISRYLHDDSFDEFNRINNIRGQTGNGKRDLSNVADRKITICDSIQQWPVNKWISFDEAYRFTLASENMFSVCHRGSWNLYFSDKMYGSLEQNCSASDLDRQFLRAFIFESMATLGLIDIAYVCPHHLWPEMRNCWGIDDLSFCSRYDGLLYVKLNHLGAYCFGNCDNYEAPKPQQRKLFRVLADHELALTEGSDIPAADKHLLELFAKPTSDFVWRLDKGLILKHLETGGSLDILKVFLNKNTDGEIPENVKVFLDDIEKRSHTVCGVQEAILLELDAPATANLIAHDNLAGKCCYLSGDRHITVPKNKETAFRNALKKMGYVLPQ